VHLLDAYDRAHRRNGTRDLALAGRGHRFEQPSLTLLAPQDT
jgi:hypothetical protein